MKKIGNAIWGLVLIVVGVIFALNSLEITNIDIFFKGWWTLPIIVPCFIDLFNSENKTGNIIVIIAGVLLLLASRGIIDFDLLWKLLFPSILVIIGFSLVFRDLLDKELRYKIKKLNDKASGEYLAVLGGQNINLANEDFKGTDLLAIFGGLEIDLRNAKIKEDVVINANAIFGGIDIIVPDNVKVKVTSTPIFGGVSDKRKQSKDDAKYTIYVKSVCLFGGIDIK